MIREIIVTSPAGVRLAFEASGEKGLVARRGDWNSLVMDIRDPNKLSADFPEDGAIIGMVPTSWLVEFNDVVT